MFHRCSVHYYVNSMIQNVGTLYMELSLGMYDMLRGKNIIH